MPPQGPRQSLLSTNPTPPPRLESLSWKNRPTLVRVRVGEGFDGIFVIIGFLSRNGFQGSPLSWSSPEKSIDPSLTKFRAREVQLRSDYENYYFILTPNLHDFRGSYPGGLKSTRPCQARLDELHVGEIRVQFGFRTYNWANSSQRGILTKIPLMQLTRPPESDWSSNCIFQRVHYRYLT